MINLSCVVVVCCCIASVWCSDEGVAFTAYLGKSTTIENLYTIIVYDKVVTNVGNGYDSNTGNFTAPSDGLYVFTVVVETVKTKKKNAVIVVHLMVDDKPIVAATARSYTKGQNVQASTSAVVELKIGQKVFIHTYGYNPQYFEATAGLAFNSFTGYRIA